MPLTGDSWNELVSLIPLQGHVEVLNQSLSYCSTCSEIPSVLSAVTSLLREQASRDLLSPYIESEKCSVFPVEFLEIIEKRQEQSSTGSQANFRLGGNIIYFSPILLYCQDNDLFRGYLVNGNAFSRMEQFVATKILPKERTQTQHTLCSQHQKTLMSEAFLSSLVAIESFDRHVDIKTEQLLLDVVSCIHRHISFCPKVFYKANSHSTSSR